MRSAQISSETSAISRFQKSAVAITCPFRGMLKESPDRNEDNYELVAITCPFRGMLKATSEICHSKLQLVAITCPFRGMLKGKVWNYALRERKSQSPALSEAC